MFVEIPLGPKVIHSTVSYYLVVFRQCDILSAEAGLKHTVFQFCERFMLMGKKLEVMMFFYVSDFFFNFLSFFKIYLLI